MITTEDRQEARESLVERITQAASATAMAVAVMHTSGIEGLRDLECVEGELRQLAYRAKELLSQGPRS